MLEREVALSIYSGPLISALASLGTVQPWVISSLNPLEPSVSVSYLLEDFLVLITSIAMEQLC